MDKSVLDSFVTRLLSGVVLLVAVLLSLLSQYSFTALVIVIAVGAVSEFSKFAKGAGFSPLYKYNIVAVAVAIVLNFLVASGMLPPKSLVLLFALLFVPFAVEMYRKRENPIGNIASTLMGLIYVGLPLSLLIWLGVGTLAAPMINEIGDGDALYHGGVILSYICIVWSNDVGAYLVGITIGRRRLFERISPKKSWEGFFGGVIAAVIAGIIAADIMDRSIYLWGVMGLVISVSGVFGDLVESLFKRSIGIKDSGAIMPGHGGFLDRFDALIYSLPFVFIYFVIFAA